MLDGKTVTADALHDQHKTARIIIEKGGNYFLQVKGNQGNLLKMTEEAFKLIKPRYGAANKKHGRIEQRALAVVPTTAMRIGFPYARSLFAVWLKCERSGKETVAVRYYISSLDPEEHTAAQWHRLIRGHWGGIENRNHWSRDAIWREDATRSRNPHLVGNLALLRNTLLAIVEHERELYGSLPAFTEAMQADQKRPFNLIVGNLRR